MPTIPKVIGIVGSRRRDSDEDLTKLRKLFFKLFKRGDKIVSGGCKQGGDRFAEILARDYGCTIIIHHANWGGPEGKKAGFSRNTLIAEDCNILIALRASDHTGGTEDTVTKANRLGKKVIEC